MSDPILTTEKVKLYDIYSKIISLLTEAGWEDVSSNPATDGNIMHSKGESGDMDLFLGFSKDAGGTDTNPFGSSTTADCIYIKLIYDYRPGASGKSGTYDSRRNETWKKLIKPFNNRGIMSLDDEIYMHYNVNKNRILCYFEPLEKYKLDKTTTNNPTNYQLLNINSPYFFTFGYQDGSLIKGTKSSSVIFAHTNGYDEAYSRDKCALACSYATTVSSDAIYVQSYSFNATKEGTLDRKVPMLPIWLGTDKEGLLCSVDGIKVINYNSDFARGGRYLERFISDDDIVTLSNKSYKACAVYFSSGQVSMAPVVGNYYQLGILRINSLIGDTIFFRRIK